MIMKVKVVRQFTDRHTDILHKVGEELTITKKRFDEIAASPHTYVEEIKPKKAVKANDA